MKKQVLSVLIGLSLLGGWALLKKRSTPTSKTPLVEDEASSESKVQKTPARQLASNGASKPQANQQTLAPSAQTPNSAVASNGKSRTVPAGTLQDLQDFHTWHSKPFLNSEEERQKKEMLLDPAFLRKLGDLLVTTEMMSDPKFEEAENAALDLLVESLKSGDRRTSLEVIQNIISDKQVENEKLPQNVREVLAGVKGELLYHAVAVAPQEFSNVPSLLPGPVSQKIWANVQSQHRQNLAESQIEVQQYQSKKSQF